MKKLAALLACLSLALIVWAALPATEAFTNTDGVDLAVHNASWTQRSGLLEIGTNALRSTAGNSVAMWNADTFADNQYAQGVVAASSALNRMGPAVRVSASGNVNAYQIQWNTEGHSMGRIDNDVWVELVTTATQYAINDVSRIEASGTTITAVKNGTTDPDLAAQTDSTYASGSGGVWGRSNSANTRLDTWEAGNLAGAAPTPKRRQPVTFGSFRWFMVWLSPPPVHAQGTTRLYLMPITLNGNGALGPKYRDTHMSGLSSRMMDNGGGATAIVLARDIPAATHTLLAAELDVTAIPQNLDGTVGLAETAVRAALEALNVPQTCATSTDTYRQVLACTGKVFQFEQRMNGLGFANLFQAGVTPTTQFNQLPVGVRQNLQTAAIDMGFTTTGMTGTTTLRVILKNVADQWSRGPLLFGPETL